MKDMSAVLPLYSLKCHLGGLFKWYKSWRKLKVWWK